VISLLSQFIDNFEYFLGLLATIYHVRQRIVLTRFHQVVAGFLSDVEHEGCVDILRQLTAQEANLVVGQCRFPGQKQGGQVARLLLLLGTVHHQAPGVVIRVQDVGVVDALIWNGTSFGYGL